MTARKIVALSGTALAAMTFVACAGEGGPVALTGAGATFPYPVYSKWFSAFHDQTGHQINYQSIGSGAGVQQFVERTVDFGATDGPMTDDEMAAVNGQVLHIPTVLGAVVLTWNLPELGDTPLQLDGALVADIFLGRVTKWNDPRIAEHNPGVALPDRDLIVVHRSDGSGTSFIFTDYLAKVSPDWQAEVGVGKALNWPVGLGGRGNEGVTQQIKQVEGSMGYVELIYAISNDLPVAAIRNAAGEYVVPSLASVSASAEGIDWAEDTDFRVSVTNSPGGGAYPISSFTWLLVNPAMTDQPKAAALRQFLEWMTSAEARAMAGELHYAPLPDAVNDLVSRRIASLGQ